MLISVCIFELKIKLLFGGAYTFKGKFSTLTVVGSGLFVVVVVFFGFLFQFFYKYDSHFFGI